MTHNSDWFKKTFEDEMAEGRDITNIYGDILSLVEGENWEQCYNSSSLVRSQLPKSWFISDKTGNVVTVDRNGKLRWLVKVDNGKGYKFYSYSINGKTKTILCHTLSAIVFGSDIFGKAAKLLEEKGINAFGNAEDKDNLNCHHKHSMKTAPGKAYDPENLQIMSVDAHLLLHNAPGKNASAQERQEFMKKLADLQAKECPGQIMIACVDGDEKYIGASKGIYMTPEVFNILKGAGKALYSLMNDEQSDEKVEAVEEPKA